MYAMLCDSDFFVNIIYVKLILYKIAHDITHKFIENNHTQQFFYILHEITHIIAEVY